MFSNIQVGDYVIIEQFSSRFASNNKCRKKVVDVKKKTFRCENDQYSYNISNGNAWGMTYRWASQYNELEWERYCQAQSVLIKRNKITETIRDFSENSYKYTLKELEKVADLIKQINEEKQKTTTIYH